MIYFNIKYTFIYAATTLKLTDIKRTVFYGYIVRERHGSDIQKYPFIVSYKNEKYSFPAILLPCKRCLKKQYPLLQPFFLGIRIAPEDNDSVN